MGTTSPTDRALRDPSDEPPPGRFQRNRACPYSDSTTDARFNTGRRPQTEGTDSNHSDGDVGGDCSHLLNLRTNRSHTVRNPYVITCSEIGSGEFRMVEHPTCLFLCPSSREVTLFMVLPSPDFLTPSCRFLVDQANLRSPSRRTSFTIESSVVFLLSIFS